MRVFLSRTDPFRARQWAGVSRYTTCLVRAMRQQASDLEFYAAHFSLRGNLPMDCTRLLDEFGIALIPVRLPDLSGWAGYYEWLDCWVVPRRIDRLGAQVAWGTNCSVPSSCGRRFRAAVTIHDLFLLKHPELADPKFYRHTLRQVESLARRCDLVLTDSEFSRGQITELLGIPPERIVVTHLAPAPATSEPASSEHLDRLELRLPPVLSVGTVEARKNYVRGMQAFARFRSTLNEDIHWLIIGGRGWQWETVYAERARTGLDESVHIFHDVSDAELAALYRDSRFLFFPSPHEGFGLPAVEAMAAGLPVVAARAGALPEVVADAAQLVDAYSPEDMANGLMRVMADDVHRDLVAKGRRRVQQFSWSAAAARVIESFRTLIA